MRRWLTVFVLGRGCQTEDASWWPKHGTWVKGSGYTGIWSPADERWFQRRREAILTGKAGPLNATTWKNKLKRQKKAGSLWDVVENHAWEFTHREFVQTQASHLPPEMRPKTPDPSAASEKLVDVPEQEGSVDVPEHERSVAAPEQERPVAAAEEEGPFDP